METKFNFDRWLIGTIYDTKKERINSSLSQLRYWKKDKNEELIKYWTALIKIRKIMRKFLDMSWKRNKKKVKTREDFNIFILSPAEKKMVSYFQRPIMSLATGNFGNRLIKKYSKVNRRKH